MLAQPSKYGKPDLSDYYSFFLNSQLKTVKGQMFSQNDVIAACQIWCYHLNARGVNSWNKSEIH